jgi:hypothetical protein
LLQVFYALILGVVKSGGYDGQAFRLYCGNLLQRDHLEYGGGRIILQGSHRNML